MGKKVQSIQNLVQSSTYDSLTWKATVSHDLNRLHSFTQINYQDLTAEGKQKADQSGYAQGDTITFQILAERQAPAGFEMLDKNESPAAPWHPQKIEKQKEGCFIATAAFGSPLASELIVLKQFRDDFLNQYSAGRKLTRFYYSVAPPLASIVARSKTSRWIVRIFILGICLLIRSKHKKESNNEHF